MKVIIKHNKFFSVEFCCSDIAKVLTSNSSEFHIKHGNASTINTKSLVFVGEEPIYYCPFCGTKIEKPGAPRSRF